MPDPISTTLITLAITELGPPIVKETGKVYKVNNKVFSDIRDSALETPAKTALWIVIGPTVNSILTAATIAEGVVKGVERYIDS